MLAAVSTSPGILPRFCLLTYCSCNQTFLFGLPLQVAGPISGMQWVVQKEPARWGEPSSFPLGLLDLPAIGHDDLKVYFWTIGKKVLYVCAL